MPISIEQTEEFGVWLKNLKDFKGKARVLARITAMGSGNFGDSKSIGDNVAEMRIHTGPGYRLYYSRVGNRVYLLLLGGDKSSQQQDITMAKKLAVEYADKDAGRKKD